MTDGLQDPIPSNDPNDPLNWPTAWKITTYGSICLFSFVANVSASNFTVAIVPLETAFHVDATHATWLVGFNVLMFGLGNILWVPLMRVFGKRPVYLISIAILVAANAWSATAATWGSLLGGRMVSGFAGAAADATVPSAVAEMFFLEERGHCMMFFHLALATGIFVGPTINAYIVQLHSWRWSCGFLSCAAGLCLVLAVFFIRETQYYKPRQQYAPADIPVKRTYLGWLGLTVGYNRDRPLRRFLITFWDIVCMALYPPVFYVGCLAGIFVGWIITMQVTVSQTFVRPPYNFSLGAVGLFSFSGWIGVLLSFYFGGKLIDLLANRARRHDHTLKPRPEKRLLAIVIPFVIAPVGLIVFGQCVARRTSWVGPAFGYGMHSFGFTSVSNIAVTYAVDCYQGFAGEALVTVFVIRNVIALVCSFYSNAWIARDGLSSVSHRYHHLNRDVERASADALHRSLAQWPGSNGHCSCSPSSSTSSPASCWHSRTVTAHRTVCSGNEFRREPTCARSRIFARLFLFCFRSCVTQRIHHDEINVLHSWLSKIYVHVTTNVLSTASQFASAVHYDVPSKHTAITRLTTSKQHPMQGHYQS